MVVKLYIAMRKISWKKKNKTLGHTRELFRHSLDTVDSCAVSKLSVAAGNCDYF